MGIAIALPKLGEKDTLPEPPLHGNPGAPSGSHLKLPPQCGDNLHVASGLALSVSTQLFDVASGERPFHTHYQR